MYYTIYKTTNLLNGRFYIGCHKTRNLDDNYIGSGKYLLLAIKKYGKENFIKEILYTFSTPKEMYAKEAEIVTKEFLLTENTYNLKVGGFGGFDYINSTGKNVHHKGMHISRKNLICGSALIERLKQKNKYDEYIKNKSEAQMGKKNSQYGTTWVWNQSHGNKSIKKELLGEYINQGWEHKYVRTRKPR